MNVFVKQYKFNMGIAPRRMSLQDMKMGVREFIWEYTKRWHEVAAQVNPPLLENEG